MLWSYDCLFDLNDAYLLLPDYILLTKLSHKGLKIQRNAGISTLLRAKPFASEGYIGAYPMLYFYIKGDSVHNNTTE